VGPGQPAHLYERPRITNTPGTIAVAPKGIPPIHSIIIPHRDRLKRLLFCIWSIERSARLSYISNYEIIVSDQHSAAGACSVAAAINYSSASPEKISVVADSDPRPPTAETPDGVIEVFSKPKALNLGITASQGDILTFLDADAVVGSHWMEGARALSYGWWPDTTRLCYRVRYLPEETGEVIPGARTEEAVADMFRRYEDYPRAFEGYASPEINSTGCWDPNLTFGNSQFSIRRKVLGATRCDERFKSSGYEDLAFTAAIWRQAGYRYKGVILTESPQAMFHIRNTREPYWYNSHLADRNREMYTDALRFPCRALTDLKKL